MLPPLVVFWLAGPAGHGASQVLEQWAADRGYRPVAAAESPQQEYDESLVREIEVLLEEARSGAPSTVGSLDLIDQLVVAHPELPQASFWMAERYALEAQYRARGTAPNLDAERELGRRSSELEGARAPAVGAEAAALETGAEHDALELFDVRPRDEVLLDGRSVTAGALAEQSSRRVAPGRHHIQLFRAQRRVWAGWAELGSPPQLRIPDPTLACSELDLWGTEPGALGPVAAPSVRCNTWAVARARGGELELSFCRGDRCGAWERRAGAAELGPSAETTASRHELSPWITWGAIGIGAAASTLLVLWQAGAFDRTPAATEFVFTGPTAAAFRF
ncbi:MAG: hypothetical protein ABI895_29530 [Deltaproteobacteria bacterium]